MKTKKAKLISRTEAVKKIENSGGKFFGATFTKKNGETRTINCNHAKGAITKLGYVMVNCIKDKSIKNIDPRTLSALSINKEQFRVK